MSVDIVVPQCLLSGQAESAACLGVEQWSRGEQGSTERPGTIIIVRGGQGQPGLYTTLHPELLSQAGTQHLDSVRSEGQRRLSRSRYHVNTEGHQVVISDLRKQTSQQAVRGDQSRVGRNLLAITVVTSD